MGWFFLVLCLSINYILLIHSVVCLFIYLLQTEIHIFTNTFIPALLLLNPETDTEYSFRI